MSELFFKKYTTLRFKINSIISKSWPYLRWLQIFYFHMQLSNPNLFDKYGVEIFFYSILKQFS